MKEAIVILFAVAFGLVLSGCSQKKETSENKIPNPISDPGGYVPGMLDIKKEAEKNIQNAVDQENKKVDDTLNENDQSSSANTNDNQNLSKKYMYAMLKTNLGDIKVKFYSSDAPNTVNNFLKLANEKFYDGTKFHRVIKGFMIQGGDPNSKNSDASKWGMGGPGYSFADEINARKLVKGSLAMANSGPNTNGSQFFIVTADATPWLDGKHTNFGEVVSGMDIVQKIENVKTGTSDRPAEDLVLKSMELLEK